MPTIQGNLPSRKVKVFNLFGGPGVGKSTSAAGLFFELKHQMLNVELVHEYAKGAAWEQRRKVFEAQEYIFGKQCFSQHRLWNEVDYIVTDSPILLCAIYMPDDYFAPSLKDTVWEAWRAHDNFNVLLTRSKPYVAKGRTQNEEEAREVDTRVRDFLDANAVPYFEVTYDRETPVKIIQLAQESGFFT